MAPEPFALLDDANASAAQPSSRLYTGFAHEHVCADPAGLDALWSQVEADQRGGLHALLLADCEWGARLIAARHVAPRADEPAVLRVLMFRTVQHLAADAVAAWLAGMTTARPLAPWA